MKTLTAYQASAGSGKTFNLVKEFLTILFLNYYCPQTDLGGRDKAWTEWKKKQDEGDPEGPKKYSGSFDFQRILGVTFTKKATLELKQRVLKELIQLSKLKPGEPFPGISEQVVKELPERSGVPESVLRQEMPVLARRLVKQILEGYTHFSVRTIDSFFQEVLRGLRREIIGESAGSSYQIEIDVSGSIDLAMDSMKMAMDGSDYLNISEVVRDLLMSSIGTDERANPFKEITEIANKIINSDEWEELKPTLLSGFDPQKYRDLKTHVNRVISEADDRLKEIVDKALKIKAFSPSKWKTKIEPLTGIDSLIKGISKGAITTEDLDKLKLTVNDSKREGADAIITLRDEISKALPAPEDLVEYNTAQLMADYLSYLPILSEILLAVESYERSNHLLLIPRVNQLLSQIIDDSEAPFVYDRVGVRLRNYLIDEFQDTSTLQWHNFKPLISEARANGGENYIVGDAKQSIYAFRGANSSNFINLIQEIKEENQPDEEQVSEVINLPTNWRSQGRVVDFNNTFFSNIYRYSEDFQSQWEPPLEESHREVYVAANVHQSLPEGKSRDEGYISITQVPRELFYTTREDDPDSIKELTHRTIDDLFRRGYKNGDIAILTRKTKESSRVAQWLKDWPAETEGKYAFINDEALFLTSSRIVRLLQSLIKAMAVPCEETRKKLEIQVSIHDTTMGKDPEERPSTYERLMSLPIAGLTIYEFVMRAVDILGEIPKEERMYVNAFIDITYSFTHRSPDLTLGKFDEWLDKKLAGQTVQMGNSKVNRISLITIHKSKGLEYPVVLMPFAKWDIDNRTKTELRLLPIPEGFGGAEGYCFIDMRESAKGFNSLFEPYFEMNREVKYMEELNLLYVAFTRAKSELHIFTQVAKGDGSASNPTISDIIASRLPQDNSDQKWGTSLVRSSLEMSGKAVSTWHTPGELPLVDPTMHEASGSARHASLDRMVRLTDLEDLRLASKYSDENTDLGLLLHSIMADVMTGEDFAPLLQNLLTTGKIDRELHDQLVANFSRALEGVAKDWFPPIGSAIVRTEATIYGEGRERRPDRVVLSLDGRKAVIIDYKTGEKSSAPSGYISQVKRYVKSLKEAGVEEVDGYLWYLRDPDGIIKVC